VYSIGLTTYYILGEKLFTKEVKMEKELRQGTEIVEENPTKKLYEKPEIQEHDPLEESTAFIYYYYI
jgi:hypothetical protein